MLAQRQCSTYLRIFIEVKVVSRQNEPAFDPLAYKHTGCFPFLPQPSLTLAVTKVFTWNPTVACYIVHFCLWIKTQTLLYALKRSLYLVIGHKVCQIWALADEKIGVEVKWEHKKGIYHWQTSLGFVLNMAQNSFIYFYLTEVYFYTMDTIIMKDGHRKKSYTYQLFSTVSFYGGKCSPETGGKSN